MICFSFLWIRRDKYKAGAGGWKKFIGKKLKSKSLLIKSKHDENSSPLKKILVLFSSFLPTLWSKPQSTVKLAINQHKLASKDETVLQNHNFQWFLWATVSSPGQLGFFLHWVFICKKRLGVIRCSQWLSLCCYTLWDASELLPCQVKCGPFSNKRNVMKTCDIFQKMRCL